MTIWFLDDAARLLREKADIAALQERAEWLLGSTWGLTEGRLFCDATIQAHGQDYDVRMTYPTYFPALPPEVRPRGTDARWSGHQYGTGGVLCLEWGPDNWQEDVTGAQLLESAHRLLHQENPLGDPAAGHLDVPSRHELTLGQELRGRGLRSFLSAALLQRVHQLSPGEVGRITVGKLSVAGEHLACVWSLRRPQDPEAWEDDTLPAVMRGVITDDGFVIRTLYDVETLNKVTSIDELVDLVRQLGFPSWPHQPDQGFDVGDRFLHALLLDDGGTPHHITAFRHEDSIMVARWRPVPDDRAELRMPHEASALTGASVAIVGAGSLGSKVAVSLARAGVRRFHLVDHDVLLPGNLVRHALDWSAVGFHKVHALAEALKRVAPGITVNTSNVHLGGQESNAVAATALEQVMKCTVVVDATADAATFGLLGSVAARAGTALVWGLVYAGGLGGLVARCRPGADPAPLTMRAAYLQFCEDHQQKAEELVEARGYDAPAATGRSLLATDADLAVIAGHVTRFVLDALLPDPSIGFPHSMYLVGLRRGWVFEAPLETFAVEVPADARETDPPVSAAALPEEDQRALVAFIHELAAQQASPPTGPDETAARE